MYWTDRGTIRSTPNLILSIEDLIVANLVVPRIALDLSGNDVHRRAGTGKISEKKNTDARTSRYLITFTGARIRRSSARLAAR